MKKLVYYLSFVLILASCQDNGISDPDPVDPIDPTDTVETTIGKKGVAFTNKSKAWSHKTSTLKAHWMYSWGNVLREEIPENVEFVPMFWGKGSVNDDNINRIKGLVAEGKVKYILGFNEPDGVTQANMTVDEAIELWPRLEEIGVPIGSPATVSPDNEWMVDFMQRVEDEGLRVDFIAIHHYGGTSVTNFINKIGNAHRDYGDRPVWVTEFAVADWEATSQANNRYSVAEVKDFMNQVLPALEDIEWLHRYAWFSGTNAPLINSSLFNEESETVADLTEVGEVYAAHAPNADIGAGVDTEFEPEVDPDEFVLNPGFESGSTSPWGGFKNGVVGATSDFTPYEGNFSGRIENGDGSLFQEFPIEGGKTYTMEYYSKWRDPEANPMKPTIRTTLGAGNTKLFDLPDTPLTTDWEKSTYEFSLSADTDSLRIVFYKPNGFSPFYLDNVSIKVKE